LFQISHSFLMYYKHFFLVSLFFLTTYSCSIHKNRIQQAVNYTRSNNPEVKKITPSFLSSKLEEYAVSSEFFPAISQNERIRFLILHYTACDMKTAVKTLTTKEVSSHYLISDSLDNQIHLLVTEDKRAWHAGISHFKGMSNLNDISIGIEIVNLGFKTGILDEFLFYYFPDYQIKKIAALTKDIATRYKIDPTFILGHSDIAPQRKYDPGPLFPWKKLYEEYGIGAWYEEDMKSNFLSQYDPMMYNLPEFITLAQQNLLKYGYEIKITGKWDEQTKKVIQAFQFHFNPENYSGILDAETWAILQALNERYRK
jgi:N-acetylmuramoyl-L-alanine amidase